MFGVHLCIHPSVTGKRVVIHQGTCSKYKLMSKKGHSKGMYTFNKNTRNLREAIDRASMVALEWHAPIQFCKTCFKPGRNINCSF